MVENFHCSIMASVSKLVSAADKLILQRQPHFLVIDDLKMKP
jgi:hypothetical protein